jgi:hypothetical protein
MIIVLIIPDEIEDPDELFTSYCKISKHKMNNTRCIKKLVINSDVNNFVKGDECKISHIENLYCHINRKNKKMRDENSKVVNVENKKHTINF